MERTKYTESAEIKRWIFLYQNEKPDILVDPMDILASVAVAF